MNGHRLRVTQMSGETLILINYKFMKKLNLEIAKASLSREEMRMITGGSGGGSCWLRCDDWTQSMAVNDCSKSTRKFYCGGSDPIATCNCN